MTRVLGPLLAGLALVAIAVAAIRPELVTGLSPVDTDVLDALRPPGHQHLFGTDELGRDVFARTVYAAGASLAIGLGATAVGALTGAVVGVAATLGGRAVDLVLMRVVDALLAFPELLLALLVAAVIGPGTVNALLAIGLATMPHYARVVRSRALVVRRSDFVEAARVLGVPWPLVVLRHIVPNTVGPLSVLATLGVARR
ncbi:ABC transporter permease [Kutzneria sp. 744]|uniref:ABC transporter permease n=1 Tax=Kutzneria sp. (strain 744) TaxID=345341 RepID=UPI0018DD99A6|nr:ABC transporter permease [Kutzneria sp. 744]